MKRKKFTFFAYNPPTTGKFTINGFDYQSDEDYRNVARCREYKNCGFEIMQLRYEHAYNGEEWETSNANYMWNVAYEAGIRKMLVTDLRIDYLIRPKRGIVSDVCEKYTEEELDKLLAEYVAPYKDKKGFYGIQLLDEPEYEDLPAYGAVARSLQRILPKAYLQMNLHPLGTISIEGVADKREAYEVYANEALERTGLSHICFDEYPFRREYIISGNTIRNYQVIARVCKQRGVEMQAVLQSFANTSQGKYLKRRVTENDMYWQTNLAMGFGVKEYAFYTYMPKWRIDFMKGGDGIDGACFINNDGSQTALYRYTRRIIKEMQAFSKVALQYNYENNYIITEKGKTIADFEHTLFAENKGTCPFSISVDRGLALVTEQKNGEDTLYMIENIGNIKDELCGEKPMTVEFVLPKGDKTFYTRGKQIQLNETDGKYILSLKTGEAIFVEIKK